MATEKKLSKKELKNFIKDLTNLNSYVIISYRKERKKELKRIKKKLKTLDNLEFLCYNKSIERGKHYAKQNYSRY